ncbi:hypothetical protein D3C71_1562510 [compost metagenome]
MHGASTSKGSATTTVDTAATPCSTAAADAKNRCRTTRCSAPAKAAAARADRRAATRNPVANNTVRASSAPFTQFHGPACAGGGATAQATAEPP